MLVAPEELCPAVFLPAPPPLPAELSSVVASLELQLAPINRTDGTSNNQPNFLILYGLFRV
jgi:hypothetical protein